MGRPPPKGIGPTLSSLAVRALSNSVKGVLTRELVVNVDRVLRDDVRGNSKINHENNDSWVKCLNQNLLIAHFR